MKRCQECAEPAIACYLPDLDRGEMRQPTVDAYLCPEHAFERGHCKGCGDFWGGVESFEFLNGGYCDDCKREIDRADEVARGSWAECDGCGIELFGVPFDEAGPDELCHRCHAESVA